jgi:hypothetical protein
MANILGSRAALRGETRRQQSKFEVYLTPNPATKPFEDKLDVSSGFHLFWTSL